MTRQTNAERLTAIETRLDGFKDAICKNGKAANEVKDMMEDHMRETQEHRVEMIQMMSDIKDRIAKTETKTATIEARIGMAVIGLGAVILLFWTLTTEAVKGFFTGGAA